MTAHSILVERPEIIRDVSRSTVIADVEKPLSVWERLYRVPLLRKALILAALAVIWELYGRWLDNPLLFPPFSAMPEAFVTDLGNGIVPARSSSRSRRW